jgi:hypothetical protein
MSERKPTGLITHPDRAFFFAQNIERKPMLILKSPSSIDFITDHDILKLVKLRHDQLGDEMFDSVFIIEAGDTVEDIEQEIGFSLLTNLFDDVRYPDPDFVPCFEVLEDHGGCYEMLFILSDGDDAIEIFIPKTGVDPLLLSMCSQFAVVLN